MICSYLQIMVVSCPHKKLIWCLFPCVSYWDQTVAGVLHILPDLLINYGMMVEYQLAPLAIIFCVTHELKTISYDLTASQYFMQIIWIKSYHNSVKEGEKSKSLNNCS